MTTQTHSDSDQHSHPATRLVQGLADLIAAGIAGGACVVGFIVVGGVAARYWTLPTAIAWSLVFAAAGFHLLADDPWLDRLLFGGDFALFYLLGVFASKPVPDAAVFGVTGLILVTSVAILYRDWRHDDAGESEAQSVADEQALDGQEEVTI